MDHIRIPDSFKPQAREVPYLDIAPKYDGLGLSGFPERHDRDPDKLVASYSILQWRADWIESFIQEWLWFGLIDEFGKACGVTINRDDFIKDSPSGTGKIISTEKLYDVYARRAVVRKLDIEGVCLGLEKGDLVRLPYDPSQKAIDQVGTFVLDTLMSRVSRGEVTAEGMLAHTKSTLSQPYGDDTNCKDRSGVTVPLDVLVERIISCNVARTTLAGGQTLDRSLGLTKAPLAESIARAQMILRTIRQLVHQAARFEILLSIDILCHTLAKVVHVVFHEDIPLHSPSYLSKLEESMCARNWCISRVGELLNEPRPLSYVASLLPSYEVSPHRECTPRKCLKRPATTAAMVVKHTDTCDQNCLSATVKESELIDMWKSGGVPGLRVTNKLQPDQVEVVDCVGKPFVAISHVWAHGLGNNAKNELPSCQVKCLWELAQKLGEEEEILWIDTLVVPIEHEAKRTAISKLRTVYSEASKVLVIDKDLMQVGPDPLEQTMQLLASDWLRRLWTLQEGRLARELFVQFRDRAVPVSDLTTQTAASEFDVFDCYLLLTEDIRNRFTRLEALQSRWAALVEDLAPRSVTGRSDEPICLATLLGLSLEDFHPYPTMQDIYRFVGDIPADLIFLEQPRLDVRGLTWAPASFLETEFVSLVPGKGLPPLGRLTADGITITKDCLQLDEVLHFRRIRGKPAEVYIITAPNGLKLGIRAPDIVSPEGAILRTEASRMIRRPMVIWERPLEKFALTTSSETVSKAVLVNKIEDRDGISYCQFEMRLEGWSIRDEHLDVHELLVSRSGGVIGNLTAKTMEKKTFCIG